MILAASISFRTNNADDKLRAGVASTWGTAQEQTQPLATLEPEEDVPVVLQTATTDANSVTAAPIKLPPTYLDPERSRVHVDLALDYRQKGLMWYGTYVVKFSVTYIFRNTAVQPRRILLTLVFPAQQAVYDDLTISADGKTLPFSANQTGATAWVPAAAGQAIEYKVAYQSRGLESWSYSFGKDIKQARDFALVLNTNFARIDFPSNTLSPTDKKETNSGWELTWKYRNLISGFQIGMAMPEKLQPGPLAGQICAFAPVSLLLFFFVIFVLTTIQKIDLHPMHYFFLAASFFAFHLLLAYSVDHISIQAAFLVSSVVSVSLVVSYLRIVVGPQFAIAEAGLAQMVYLVLFSFSFFLKGLTGLAITLGCIVTLFVAMQVTARVQWRDQFAGTTAEA